MKHIEDNKQLVRVNDKENLLDEFLFLDKLILTPNRTNAQHSYRVLPLEQCENLFLLFDFINLHPHSWLLELTVEVHSQERLLNRIDIRQPILGNEEEPLSFCLPLGNGQPAFWKNGRYMVLVKWKDEVVYMIPFRLIKEGQAEICTGTKTYVMPLHHTSVHERSAFSPFHGERGIMALVGQLQAKENFKALQELIEFADLRRTNDIKSFEPTLHAVVTGNPGTGKHHFVTHLAEYLQQKQIIQRAEVQFHTVNDFYSSNVNGEFDRVRELFKESEGGLLVVENAHELADTSSDSYDSGKKVLHAIRSELPKYRQLVVIFMGKEVELNGLFTALPELRALFPHHFPFTDLTTEELLEVADKLLAGKAFILQSSARKKLRDEINRARRTHPGAFTNAKYLTNLIANHILPAMASRVKQIASPTRKQLMLIEKSDIPSLEIHISADASLKKLQEMVGLENLKRGIGEHLSMVQLIKLQKEAGMEVRLPPLHAIFTGNPGTGKTTVAQMLGRIYKAMGLLTGGEVIRVKREDLVGQYVGQSEKLTREVIRKAYGNILFVDEAYNLSLNGNQKDFGQRCLEVIMTELEKDNPNLMVIMAGYPADMERLLASNAGLKSRFPNTFHFEDYNADQLYQIALSYIRSIDYHITPKAQEQLQGLINREYNAKDRSFGNARFVTRLITTRIIPQMGSRIIQLPPEQRTDKQVLCTIEAEDIPDRLEKYGSTSGPSKRNALPRIGFHS